MALSTFLISVSISSPSSENTLIPMLEDIFASSSFNKYGCDHSINSLSAITSTSSLFVSSKIATNSSPPIREMKSPSRTTSFNLTETFPNLSPCPRFTFCFFLHRVIVYWDNGGVAKWSNAADCKSVPFWVRRFESFSLHVAA